MDCLFFTSRRHWWERVNSTVIEFHLSNTSGSRRARTRIARLVDRDSNDCDISLSPIVVVVEVVVIVVVVVVILLTHKYSTSGMKP